MRIAIVSDYFQAVIGYAKPQIARRFIKQGHQVRVITSDRYFPFHDYQATRLQQLGPRIRSVGISTEEAIEVQRLPIAVEMFARTYILGLEEAVEEYRPEVVIVFGMSSPSAVRMARLKQSFELVLADSHLPSELAHGQARLKKLMYGGFRTLFADELKVADKFIALQEGSVEIIRDVYGVKQPIEVVDNGTDPELFRFSRARRRHLRKQLKIGSDDYVVLYTGKVVPPKGVHLLTQAFEYVLSALPNSWCVIVGDGPAAYNRRCQAELSKKVTDRILWLGSKPHDKLYGYYSLADVCVWPLQESLAMNDAASCSRSFIANDQLGAWTRISNDNAVLYKQGSRADLARKIIELGQDEDRRQAMGRRGRQLVEEMLSWDKISRQYLP